MGKSKKSYLILLRHAKSSWDHESLSDHDRPLNEQGRHDAPIMAQWLAKNDFVPDKIATSTARRTIETLDLMLSEWHLNIEVERTRDLYHATAERYLEQAATFEKGVQIGMLIGHNPGISILAGQISSRVDHMPTCSVAVFKLIIDNWEELGSIGRRGLKFVAFQSPKALDD